VNSTPYQGTNVPISNTSYNNNNNNNNNNIHTPFFQHMNNNNNNNNNNNTSNTHNLSLGDELPLLELGDLSIVEPTTSQNFRVRSLLTQRNHTQSQHRFHKKLIRPKLLQQRNAREKKFPYTTIKKSNGIRKNQSILKYSKLIDYGLAEQLESININKEVKSSLFIPNRNGKKILNIESLFPNKYIELKHNSSNNYTNRNLLSIPKVPKKLNLNDLENSMISQREFKYDNVINDWKFIINSLGLSGDMNMLKIFTLGTRFSDFVHKIQQENLQKKLYISNSNKTDIPLNFNTIETLTNQSVVNNLNSQIDAILLSVIDNDKNGLNTSQRLSAQNLLIKKSTAPLIRSIFISEYLSGRDLFSPHNEFQRRLCVLLEDSELIRFISSLVDAEKISREDQDILNRILVESTLTSIICEDDSGDMINDDYNNTNNNNNDNNNITKNNLGEEDDDENSPKQFGHILRTIYAASKNASSQEKMIENFVQRTTFLIETSKKSHTTKQIKENFLNPTSNTITHDSSLIPTNLQQQQMQQQQMQQQQMQQQQMQQQQIQQQQMQQQQMQQQQIQQQQIQQEQMQQQQQQQQQKLLPPQQIHNSIPGSFTLESRNLDKSKMNKHSQDYYSNYSGDNNTTIQLSNPNLNSNSNLNPNLNSSEPIMPSSTGHSFLQTLGSVVLSNQSNFPSDLPESSTGPTPSTQPQPQPQPQQRSQMEDPTSTQLNFNSLNL